MFKTNQETTLLLFFIFILLIEKAHCKENLGVIPFITTWKTDNPGVSEDNQITIPIIGPAVNYTVDWGDGTPPTTHTGYATHTYATAGTYTVSITGVFPRIFFAAGGDKDKILTIEQWGDNPWLSMHSAFWGCANLRGNFTDKPDLSALTDMTQMFTNAVSFNHDIGDWDVSNVKYMTSMFKGATSFNQDIGNWDVSQVTLMDFIFNRATSFNQYIGNWDVSNVTNMSGMFYGASTFNQDISDWDVSNVTTMKFMFSGAKSFNQDIGEWEVGSVTDMGAMFYGANVFNQDIGAWDLGLVNSTRYMFASAHAFNQDISNWDVSAVKDMRLMFRDATVFNQDIGTWNVGAVTDMVAMFTDAITFDQNIGGWNVANVTDMRDMFKNVELSVMNYDALLIGWNAQNLKANINFHGGNSKYCEGGKARANMRDNFNWTITDSGSAVPSIDGLSDQSASGYFKLPIITGTSLFGNEAYYTEPNGRGNIYYEGDVINYSDFPSYPITLYIYGGQNVNCSDEKSFTLSLDDDCAFVTTWRTTAANESITIPTNATGGDIYNYTVDWGDGTVTNGETGSATHSYAAAGTYEVTIKGLFPRIYFLFGNPSSFTQIQSVEQWGCNPWVSMSYAFSSCSNLVINANDVPNLSHVTDVSHMFRFATSVGTGSGNWNWDTSNVTTMTSMFNNATNFNKDIGGWDTGNVELMIDMFNSSGFNQDINNWDTSSVTSMYGMFESAKNFNKALNNWNTSNVNNLGYMFNNAVNFNQSLGNWNTSNVTFANGMFTDAGSFNQDISSWDTGNIVHMNDMFNRATSFDQDLGNWDVGSLQYAYQMFLDVTLSTINYDSLLIGWESQILNTNVNFHGGNSKYCAGANARANMVSNNNWNVTDGGPAFAVVDKLSNQTVADSFTFPVITGTNLTGNEKYYTDTNGKGMVYNAGDVINYSDFSDYPKTFYIYGGTSSGCSSEESFELTITSLPICTSLSSPLANAIEVPVDIDFTWNAVDNATGYKIIIGDDENLYGEFDLGNTLTFDLLFDLPENTRVNAQIIPYNESGETLACSKEFFTTGSKILIPSCTNLVAPFSGERDVSIDTNLQWDAQPDATGYKLSLGTQPDNYDILNAFDVGNITNYDLSNQLPEMTEIFIRITPYNSAGETSSCFEESFVTGSVFAIPNCTSLKTPINGSKNIAVSTNISWNLIPEATGYQLTVRTSLNGTETLTAVDVGNVSVYHLDSYLPEKSIIYVTVVPYNSKGMASGCITESFTTQSQVNNPPKYFTPNNDSINDHWVVPDPMNTIKNISIYNRYGKLLSVIDNITEGWDGTYMNGKLPADDYWYIIAYKNGAIQKGNLSLIR